MHTTLFASSIYLLWPGNRVDYQYFWSVVLKTLHHYTTLFVKGGHHKSTCLPYKGVRNVPVTCGFVAGINHANIETPGQLLCDMSNYNSCLPTTRQGSSPRNRMDLEGSANNRSEITEVLLSTWRPTQRVRPMISFWRFRLADCRSRPAWLYLSNTPGLSTLCFRYHLFELSDSLPKYRYGFLGPMYTVCDQYQAQYRIEMQNVLQDFFGGQSR